MDSANLGKVIVLGIAGIALFMLVTRVLPGIIAITSSILSILISFAIVALVAFGLVRFLRHRLK